MDLTIEPWIPVVELDGVKKLVSLTQVFQQGDKIRDLAVNPPQRIALMRLLICIVQAALDGPKDREDWYLCKEKIVSTSISYLKQWQRNMYLYGEKPFLQAINIDQLDNATLDKLDFRLAAGNNSILFDHGANPLGRPHDPAW